MKYACVGVSPKEAYLSFPSVDISSAVYFDELDECLRFVRNNALDIIFVRSDLPREEKQRFTSALYDINPSAVVLDVSDNSEELMLLRPIRKDRLDDTLTVLIPAIRPEKKRIYIRTFGRFVVFIDCQPCSFSGKAKEILALLVTRRGKEVSNEEIYTTIWENRPYSNRDMIVYYNALRRLKNTLRKYGISDLLISATHGQMVNTELFDCDYYDWLRGDGDTETGFEEEFLSEYSWGEYILSDMISRRH